MSEGDLRWIGRTLYMAKGKLSTTLKLWWHPPPYEAPHGTPHPEAYHYRRLFLWMPRKMWQVDFKCPHCTTPQSLRSKGMYQHIQTVLDLRDFTTWLGSTWTATTAVGHSWPGMTGCWSSFPQV